MQHTEQSRCTVYCEKNAVRGYKSGNSVSFPLSNNETPCLHIFPPFVAEYFTTISDEVTMPFLPDNFYLCHFYLCHSFLWHFNLCHFYRCHFSVAIFTGAIFSFAIFTIAIFSVAIFTVAIFSIAIFTVPFFPLPFFPVPFLPTFAAYC